MGRQRSNPSSSSPGISSDSHPTQFFFPLGPVLQSVFLAFPFSCFRVVDGVPPPPPPPPEGVMEAPICPPEPPKREIVRVTKAMIKEKASAFSSVGSAGKDEGGGVGGALSAAVFRRFHSSAPGARGRGRRRPRLRRCRRRPAGRRGDRGGELPRAQE